jgi:co-chaperonin GroES (HSP10)
MRQQAYETVTEVAWTEPSKLVRPSKLLGYVDDPKAFFAAEKRRIWDKVGDLSEFHVTGNRILVAMWTTEQEYRTKGGVFIHSPDTTKDESKWQGRSGLVLKLGPHAFKSDDQVQFTPEECCDVGDWVVLRPSDGVRFRMWGAPCEQECVLLESERGIRSRITRPDIVW